MKVKDFVSVSAIGNMTIIDSIYAHFFDIDRIPQCVEMFGDREIYLIDILCTDHVEICLKSAK